MESSRHYTGIDPRSVVMGSSYREPASRRRKLEAETELAWPRLVGRNNAAGHWPPTEPGPQPTPFGSAPMRRQAQIGPSAACTSGQGAQDDLAYVWLAVVWALGWVNGR